MNQTAIGYGCIVLSVAVHASAMLGASRQKQTAPEAPHTELELALPAAPPLTDRPQPSPAPPEAPAPPPKLRPAPHVEPARPAPAIAPTTEATPPAPELSGNTITAEGDTGWTAPAGDGQERAGPLQARSARIATTEPVRPAPAATPAATTEPLAQLSRKPVPPALAAALERNYPGNARRQGKSGEAKVRALIDAQGRVVSVTVGSESAPEFGAACKKTLLQSQWTPPLGQLGKPTATFISYRCKFRVDD